MNSAFRALRARSRTPEFVALHAAAAAITEFNPDNDWTPIAPEA